MFAKEKIPSGFDDRRQRLFREERKAPVRPGVVGNSSLNQSLAQR